MPAPLVLWAETADGASRGKGTFENNLDLLTIDVSTCNERTAIPDTSDIYFRTLRKSI